MNCRVAQRTILTIAKERRKCKKYLFRRFNLPSSLKNSLYGFSWISDEFVKISRLLYQCSGGCILVKKAKKRLPVYIATYSVLRNKATWNKMILKKKFLI
jgi:hypothetical protein